MAKKARIAGPGLIVNRHAKNSKIEIAFDPSPDGFVSAAKRENARLKVIIIPGTGAVEPIELFVQPKTWVFKFEAAQIPPDRLADLEALITEKQDVHVVLEYTPQQETLPFTAEPHKSETTKAVKDTPAEPARSQIIPLTFQGLRGCCCQITIVHDGKGWRAGYEIKVGNLEKSRSVADLIHRSSRAEAIQEAKSSIEQWAEEVEVSGSADAKRALRRRLTSVCEQIDEQLDPLIDRAELEADDREAEEFAEDDPKDGIHADEDPD